MAEEPGEQVLLRTCAKKEALFVDKIGPGMPSVPGSSFLWRFWRLVSRTPAVARRRVGFRPCIRQGFAGFCIQEGHPEGIMGTKYRHDGNWLSFWRTG